MKVSRRLLALSAVVLVIASGFVSAQETVDEAVSAIVTRLYASYNEEQLQKLNQTAILNFLTPKERDVLATRYWTFDIDKPGVISILRDTAQKEIPFWLPEAGFHKTNMTVTNMEGWIYEVWQKRMPAGHVGLGINGFDKHRPHYLVAVGPAENGTIPEITNLVPSQFSIVDLAPGAMTYHDWDDLVLKDVPEPLRGNKLLTTIRGRAREAHLVEAFRRTPFPSSKQPDPVLLTWSDDPGVSQSIQWRTDTEVKDGVVRYRKRTTEQGRTESPWQVARAQYIVMEDRQLLNDRYVHWFSATLLGLEPDTEYDYEVGSETADVWSEKATFRTAPASPKPFTFVYFSDTHCSPDWGKLLHAAFERHPETAFYTISGDLVSTGLYRDDWDCLFAYSTDVFRQRPIMPAIGNHDNQDGLGCSMYLQLFTLPRNGPPSLEPERAYSFRYSNALFVVLDATADVSAQTEWLKNRLASSQEPWKFVIFHFPPYCLEPDFDEDYADIRAKWGAQFDAYHVTMVLTGHVHDYVRTYPLKGGKVMSSPREGTTYVTSVAIPGRTRPFELPPHAAAAFVGEATYQVIQVDDSRVSYKAYDMSGAVRDEFIIER